ncbi:MAG: DUF5615 family PIN-like protein [Acidimicrobiales bacterium]
MKLLIDANLSPRVAEGLRDATFESTHVADLDLMRASDEEIFDRADEEGFVIVTADSDFGMLLALRRATNPSVIHMRHVAELSPEDHVNLLVSNLPAIADDLERGAIASLSPSRLAVRDLPLR